MLPFYRLPLGHCQEVSCVLCLGYCKSASSGSLVRVSLDGSKSLFFTGDFLAILCGTSWHRPGSVHTDAGRKRRERFSAQLPTSCLAYCLLYSTSLIGTLTCVKATPQRLPRPRGHPSIDGKRLWHKQSRKVSTYSWSSSRTLQGRGQHAFR